MRFLVFGDSIAYGFNDSHGGWVDRLKRDYLAEYLRTDDGSLPSILNLGISGDTTSGVLKRFSAETDARKWPGEKFGFVFAVGTNDTVYRGDEHESEPETYKQQLAALVKRARVYSQKILFVGLFPVVDKMLQPIPWSTTGKCYSTERMKLFDNVLKDFCQENNLPAVDLFAAFAKAGPENLLADGLHPNDAGHELIAKLVKPELKKLLV